MGYNQHPQPMLSSEASQGSGLLVPYTAGGSSRLPLRTPCARQVEGEGWGESTAILPQLPQGPQFHQRCAGTPQVTLNTSSLVDAALQGIHPHHVKVTFVTHLPWLTGLGSSCNPKASPRSPPLRPVLTAPQLSLHSCGPQKQDPMQEKGSKRP